MGCPIPQCGRFESFRVSRGAQSRNFGCANNKYIVCHAMVVCCCVSRGNARNRMHFAPKRGHKIRSGPLVGKMATSPLPSRRSPPLQSGGTKSEVAHLWARWLRHPCRLGDPHRFRAGGQNQKWPTCGQNGYVTPAVSGIPTASERGDKVRSGPLVGKVATSPLPSRGSPPLHSGGLDQKCPTSGQKCCIVVV